MQSATNTRTAATSLTEAQLREAESAFNRLLGRASSLSFYLDFAITNYREPGSEQTLAAAVVEYVDLKTREQKQDIIFEPQLITITRHLKVLQENRSAGKSVANNWG